MRGLTAEEARSLEEASLPIDTVTPCDDPAWEFVTEIDWRLTARGLYAHHVEIDGSGEVWECFNITPLGRLALRIHRALALTA